jgi:hypothetical protein
MKERDALRQHWNPANERLPAAGMESIEAEDIKSTAGSLK